MSDEFLARSGLSLYENRCAGRGDHFHLRQHDGQSIALTNDASGGLRLSGRIEIENPCVRLLDGGGAPSGPIVTLEAMARSN